jgi:hypothetical protein
MDSVRDKHFIFVLRFQFSTFEGGCKINKMSNYTSYYNTLILEYELNI